MFSDSYQHKKHYWMTKCSNNNYVFVYARFMLFWCWQKDTTTRQYRPYRVVLLFSNIKRWVFLRIRSDAFQSACDAASTKIRGWPPKTMPSSHLCVNCFRVSKIVLHGFCTESARFHPVQWLTTGAKFTSGRETWIRINYLLSIKFYVLRQAA